MPRLIASFATIACLAAAALTPAQAQPAARLAEVATGAVSGVYFPVGIALCRLPNQTRGVHGLRCAARPAEGSVGNIAALAAGETDLAIVQSYIEADAVAGAGVFAGRPPFATLREDPAVRAHVQRAVDAANAAVSPAGSIRAFTIVDGTFTEENGLLTPSLRIRRPAVAKAYARDIARLYTELPAVPATRNSPPVRPPSSR